MTPEETKTYEESEHYTNMVRFVAELTRLVMAGNANGMRVKELHAQVIYEDHEVYTHSVHPKPHDQVLSLGAHMSAIISGFMEGNHAAWEEVKKAGAEKSWPPPRREMELGFRFGSNTRGIIERAKAEADRQARDAGHAFEDEPS